MNTIILTDGTEIEIQEGANLVENTVIVDTFADLTHIADALTKDKNLTNIKYKVDANVTGVYEHMALNGPLFRSVEYTGDKKVKAVFGLREKTEIEKQIDLLWERQDTQDEAILELADIVGGE